MIANNDDAGYVNSLLSMFGQALRLAETLPDTSQTDLVTRLEKVRDPSVRLLVGAYCLRI